MRFLKGLLCTYLLAMLTPMAAAQCFNSVKPSCEVYQSCFANRCNCKSSADEYFLTFGKSYCNAFLGQQAFTPEGTKWRDSTLRCLQEKIVPLIPENSTEKCNCGEIKRFSLNTHVDCYTKQEASICNLPASDVAKIAQTILVDGPLKALLKDKEDALKQVLSVIELCSTTAKAADRAIQWSLIHSALSSITPSLAQASITKKRFANEKEAATFANSTVQDALPTNSAMQGEWLTTNTKRSLEMDILRAFSMAKMKFGTSCFDIGCGILVKVVSGKPKNFSKSTVLLLGVANFGKNLDDAFSRTVGRHGLEQEFAAISDGTQISRDKSFYLWLDQGGTMTFPY